MRRSASAIVLLCCVQWVLRIQAASVNLVLLGQITGFPGAKQVEVDEVEQVLYVLGGQVLNAYDLKNASDPSTWTAPSLWTYSSPVELTDVAFCVKGDRRLIAVGVDEATQAAGGGVLLFSAYRRGKQPKLPQLLASATIPVPDQVIFGPRCSRIFTTIEGSATGYGDPSDYDPEGGAAVVDVSFGPPGKGRKLMRGGGDDDGNDDDGEEYSRSCNKSAACLQATVVGFSKFNANPPPGIRTRPGAPLGQSTFAQDVEPESIAISSCGKLAYITLQENNALAVVDIKTKDVVKILSFGYKDNNRDGYGLDGNDVGPCPSSIQIKPWPVKAMYMPDGIAVYNYNRKDYLITANEGDSRTYRNAANTVTYSDETNLYKLYSQLGSNFDATKAALTSRSKDGLERLLVAVGMGINNVTGKYDELFHFGGRSISIWDPEDLTAPIYDSGDLLETATADALFSGAASTPTANDYVFNGNGAPGSCDTRSDNKGPEPQELYVYKVDDDLTILAVSAGQNSFIYIFDITNPFSPTLLTVAPNPGGLRSAEGMKIVRYRPSGTSGKPWMLLVAAYKASATGSDGGVAVFRVSTA